jgi:hypothetical protein
MYCDELSELAKLLEKQHAKTDSDPRQLAKHRDSTPGRVVGPFSSVDSSR